jgi:hypothetical protein
MNAPIPDWLAEPTEPPSLDPSPTEPTLPPRPHSQTAAITALRQTQLANLLESSLVQLAEGTSLPVILRNDPRGITPGRFLGWVFRDPDRKRRYYEALELGAEIVFSEVLDIADAANNPMEDVQRSKLRIETRKWWASVANRSRFGDIKKLDVTTQNLTEDHLRSMSIDDLKRMVVSGEYRRVPEEMDDVMTDDTVPAGDDL